MFIFFDTHLLGLKSINSLKLENRKVSLTMNASVMRLCLVLVISFSSPSLATTTCPKPKVWTDCGTACPQKCSEPPVQICTDNCVAGCFCPSNKTIEKIDSNYNVVCVKDRNQCCDGGQVWTECGGCTPTCDNPDIKCRVKCIPKCECPKNKPIWHNGQCITQSQCLCPDGQCSGTVCKDCNVCQCKGNSVSCTKKGCPDLSTDDAFNSLYNNGCWRSAPSGDRCIFYSPCVDDHGEPDCQSFPGGFCRECNKCTCQTNKDGSLTPICAVNIISCQMMLQFSIDQGCWAYIKGQCRFVYPCPDVREKCCQCAREGQRSCDRCNGCECINGVKFCDKRDPCPEPTDDGCYVSRSFPGAPAQCYYISPCPQDEIIKDTQGYCSDNPSSFVCKTCLQCSCDSVLSDRPCPIAMCIDPKVDFCYLFNEERGMCEFVSPCPQSCCKTDVECRQCNECSCKDGSTVCSSDSCGDPIATGCWYRNPTSQTCEFTVPCPNDAVTDSKAFCANNPGASFCPSNDCNTCFCGNGGAIVCTLKFCFSPPESVGCWRNINGKCVFIAPCN